MNTSVDTSIHIRTSYETKAMIEQASQALGTSVNEFMLSIALHKAKELSLETLVTKNDAWQDFEARCLTAKGKLDGWQFNRDEANAR